MPVDQSGLSPQEGIPGQLIVIIHIHTSRKTVTAEPSP